MSAPMPVRAASATSCSLLLQMILASLALFALVLEGSRANPRIANGAGASARALTSACAVCSECDVCPPAPSEAGSPSPAPSPCAAAPPRAGDAPCACPAAPPCAAAPVPAAAPAPAAAGAGAPAAPAGALLRDDTFLARSMLRDALHVAMNLLAAKDNNEMGNTGDTREQTDKLFALVDAAVPRARSVCEIGFNVGHGAATLLAATSARHLVAFDCGGRMSVVGGLATLESVFGAALNLTYVNGNSVGTVPAFALDHPAWECDVIHIDGAHDGPFPAADLKNARHLARADGGTLVVFDDCNCDTEWCSEPLAVFKRAVAEGAIRELEPALGGPMLSVEGRLKGSCIGWLTARDTTPVGDIPTTIVDHRNGNVLPVKCS